MNTADEIITRQAFLATIEQLAREQAAPVGDLVERLRLAAPPIGMGGDSTDALLLEAAATIERLARTEAKLAETCGKLVAMVQEADTLAAAPAPTVSGKAREEIMRLMREDFDPTPPGWEGREWYDNAEDVSDKIIAAALSEKPTDAAEADLAKAQQERDELHAYAHEATKVITEITGGGSECFLGKIGEMYKADLRYCRERIRERECRAHERLVKSTTDVRHWREECGKHATRAESLSIELAKAREANAQLQAILDLHAHVLTRAALSGVKPATDKSPSSLSTEDDSDDKSLRTD